MEDVKKAIEEFISSLSPYILNWNNKNCAEMTKANKNNIIPMAFPFDTAPEAMGLFFLVGCCLSCSKSIKSLNI